MPGMQCPQINHISDRFLESGLDPHLCLCPLRDSRRRDSGETGQTSSPAPIYTNSELKMPGAWERFKVSTTRPTRMLVTDPVLTFFTLWVSFAWAILFLFFDSVYLTFNANCKWGVLNVGLAELSILVGAFIGIACNPIQDSMYYGYGVSMRRPTNFPTSLNNTVISLAIWILFRRSPDWQNCATQATAWQSRDPLPRHPTVIGLFGTH